MALPYLHPATVRRNRRDLLICPYASGREVVLEDRTGDVELIIDLLQEARLPRQALVSRMTSRRDGLTAAAVDRVLDRLEVLGLVSSHEDTFPLDPEQRRS